MEEPELAAPSRHFIEALPALRAAARRGPIVDLACGRGRHTLAAARAGLPSIGVDRNARFLGELGRRAAALGRSVDRVRADLEAHATIPFKPASCGAILVYRFLYRPLAPAIEAALAPGGSLLYETFTREQARRGYGPRNPDFLLDPGELPRLFPGLEVVAYVEEDDEALRPNAVARLVARKPA